MEGCVIGILSWFLVDDVGLPREVPCVAQFTPIFCSVYIQSQNKSSTAVVVYIANNLVFLNLSTVL